MIQEKRFLKLNKHTSWQWKRNLFDSMYARRFKFLKCLYFLVRKKSKININLEKSNVSRIWKCDWETNSNLHLFIKQCNNTHFDEWWKVAWLKWKKKLFLFLWTSCKELLLGAKTTVIFFGKRKEHSHGGYVAPKREKIEFPEMML